jgi:acyl-coenzyme A thioesterase PaaI-like protein
MRLPFHSDNADLRGAVDEGALAALVDTTGAMASWSLVGLDLRYKASTVSMHVNYYLPAVGVDVVATGRTLRRNNEIFFNEVTACDASTGRIVATGSVTYRIVVD